jgi:HEAT repeat protein
MADPVQPDKNEEALKQALESIGTYEFGQSRENLTLVESAVRDSLGGKKQRERMASRLAALTGSKVSADCRGFLCQQLALIGSEKEVPVLAALLSDSESGDMARRALERIPHPSALQALREALDHVKGTLLVGLINALGERRDYVAAPRLSQFLKDPEADIACAAAHALGKLSGPAALNALLLARMDAPSQLKNAVDEALLACAENLSGHGRLEEAARVHAMLNSPRETAAVRGGALCGMAKTRGRDSVPVLKTALRDSSPRVRSIAKKLIAVIEGKTS